MKVKRLERFISCVVFLALVWTIFLRCTYLFRNIGDSSRAQILGFYLEEPDSLDVVIIGGSNVYTFWDPMLAWREYGFTSYSYAVAGMTGDAVQYCLEDIRKTQNPAIIVVDVRKYLSRLSRSDINDQTYRNYLDSLDFGLERLTAVNYVRKLRGVSVGDAITEFVDLIYYHNNRSALKSSMNWEMWDNRINEPNENFYKGSRIYSPPFHHFFKEPQVRSDEVSPLDGSDEKVLRDFLTYCRKNHIEVMLVASPYIYIYIRM